MTDVMNDSVVPIEMPATDAGVLPVWRRIADDLRQAITQGIYAPGHALPTALALAETHGVHRHTVRQAFRHLQDLGLVSVEQGRGTFVTAPKLPYRLGRRVRLRNNASAAGMKVEATIETTGLGAAESLTAKQLGLRTGASIACVETSSMVGGKPLSLGSHVVSEERFPGFGERMAANNASFTQAARSYGIQDYIRLSTVLSVRQATEDEAIRLAIPEGAPVMISRGLDGLLDGTPIHQVTTVFAGERIEFVVEADTDK
jgi:GntR family transcriptional regulator, phosphonate transport system regulatory protein